MFEDLLEEQDQYATIKLSEDDALAIADTAIRGVTSWGAASSEQTSVSGTVEVCEIEGFSIRLTSSNNIFVKLPGRGRRYVYDFATNVQRRSLSGNRVNFDRGFDIPIPDAVIDKLALLLARQREVHELEDEAEATEVPVDLLEDETFEETPATVALLS